MFESLTTRLKRQNVNQSLKMTKNTKNKPDRTTMRPGCVSACIDHVTYVWRDRWTNRRVKRLSKHVG